MLMARGTVFTGGVFVRVIWRTTAFFWERGVEKWRKCEFPKVKDEGGFFILRVEYIIKLVMQEFLNICFEISWFTNNIKIVDIFWNNECLIIIFVKIKFPFSKINE